MAKHKKRQGMSRAELFGAVKRLILPALVTLVLAGVSGAYAVARIVETTRPNLALSLMPSLPTAIEAKTTQMLLDSGPNRDPGRLSAIRHLAIRSLEASPLNPAALRMLAVTGEQRMELVRSLVGTALGLSRRDVEAQLMQIELDVARNDIPATLRHYDQALRVRPSVGNLLFPTLLTAADTPALLGPIRRLVASNPAWLPRMITWTLENPDQLPRLARLIDAIPAGSEALGPGYGQPLVETLIERHDYAEAIRVHARYSAATAVPAFGAGFVYRPVDWTAAEESDFGGTVIDAPAPHVRFFAEQGAQGMFLSRLTALPPGRYRLNFATAKTADEAVGTISVNTTCQTRTAERALSGARAPVATRGYYHDFAVPEGCPFQWVRLSVASQSGSLSADLNRVSITRLP